MMERHILVEMKLISHLAVISFGAVLAFGGASLAAQEPSHQAPKPKVQIYDVKADGKIQIANALKHAKSDKKTVILQFGANWCGWCYKLHDLFGADKVIANIVRKSFIVIHIDIDKGHNADVDAKYGNPSKLGLPALVMLDANGKQLGTQDSGKLEEGDHHSPAKVIAFLNQYIPK